MVVFMHTLICAHNTHLFMYIFLLCLYIHQIGYNELKYNLCLCRLSINENIWVLCLKLHLCNHLSRNLS
ncbi:phosphatidylinositol 4-phosphate 5-kinase 1-like [Iris pallida]|uniref:Phosphatidylinositol 4-phosphate 5-kinase 1-like n=1 Tax=Iris pallida TaxID=29817 RepID=A0AAX6FAW6_IRIPA|nr:phosphatidylinositol 4-phosphate 5-kinase 1-like [Iris pallida]